MIFGHYVLALAMLFHAGQQPFSFSAPKSTAELGWRTMSVHGLIWYPTSPGNGERPQHIGPRGSRSLTRAWLRSTRRSL